MSVTVLIPGPLRDFAEGKHEIVIDRPAATVGHVLTALWERYPGMRDRVLTEQMQIREHINIFVGYESIRYSGGLLTPVPDGSEIAIIPAISGG
jgi:MoaD family protein